MTECPFCRKDDGYSTRSLYRHERIVEWNHKIYDTTVEYISGGNQCYCLSCGKIVTKYVNKNIEEEEK